VLSVYGWPFFIAGILLHFSMLTMSAAADQLNNDEHQYTKNQGDGDWATYTQSANTDHHW